MPLAHGETHPTTSASTALGLLASSARKMSGISNHPVPGPGAPACWNRLFLNSGELQARTQALELLSWPHHGEQDHLLHDLCSQQRSMLTGSRMSGMLSSASLLWTVASLVFPFPEKQNRRTVSHQPSEATGSPGRYAVISTHPGTFPLNSA